MDCNVGVHTSATQKEVRTLHNNKKAVLMTAFFVRSIWLLNDYISYGAAVGIDSVDALDTIAYAIKILQ